MPKNEYNLDNHDVITSVIRLDVTPTTSHERPYTNSNAKLQARHINDKIAAINMTSSLMNCRNRFVLAQSDSECGN